MCLILTTIIHFITVLFSYGAVMRSFNGHFPVLTVTLRFVRYVRYVLLQVVNKLRYNRFQHFSN